ncbi:MULTISPECIES: UDP-glucose/GDP-mannose dehydrogenase family protein [unclassified Meiothermus]|uniref:UDP-glucose dehydrogenase family protein n=1 Tax=unclassified Meiothermus TaxID=370471 RepID=UPI000D7CB14B|nr:MULTISPECIES: UDP-glucose/GDP-mannose dehydrogenase family protein [unclassified Meiothermus]PZA06823.1 UDP-glucose 6-dehydrogenase [Meiothermus sp. Pnk-1]RYM33104.1 UDP-glucose/GDP-mannose dehydrogenase family protein [Meiothermus sp. PNK-Is4]
MRIAIIGTGYVGLTTGVTLAYAGHEVICVDVDAFKLEKLRQGQAPIYEPGLEELLALARERIQFTEDYAQAIPQAEVVFIAVGTPPLPDGNPDLQYLRQAARSVGAHLGPGFTVVVNKSTVPIGSGNWVESLVQEAYAARNGQKPQGQFAVASNPEFLREGSAIHDSLYPDRVVVGAEDQRALEVLYTLYRPILEQTFTPPAFIPRPEGLQAVPFIATDLASAELIKYAANAFLALKISFINEIAALAERVGADVTQIAKGIGLDARIGTRFLQAGIGWGGSCFGKDTAALIATAQDYGLSMPIVAAAREVNYRQRERIVEKLLAELKILKGRTVGLLGLAFKPHTDDLRDAPALDIARRLLERGVRVRVHDPVAMENAQRLFPDLELRYCADALELAEEADALVLVTEWPQYREWPWERVASRMRRRLLLDGRNFLDKAALARLGFRYVGVGVSEPLVQKVEG